jgi:hypothetical protein
MTLQPTPLARPFTGAALSLLLLPGRALAAPSPPAEPSLDARQELDPRAELDFRRDVDRERRVPARRASEGLPGSRLRAPVWFSVGATYQKLLTGAPVAGGMLLVGLPLDRVAARGVGAAMAEDARRAPAPGSPPDGRRKLDLSPPPPPPKITVPVPVTDVPLRVPVVVTPAAARAAVDAALKRAKLVDPDARYDALASRARNSAGLPELRLRVMRTVDDGLTLSPVSYDPTRVVAVDAVRFWLEARATWKLDRLLFAEEEVALERMRHDRAEAQTRLTKEVLKLLFEWQRALATADNPTLSAEDHLSAQLKAIEAEAELDLLTDGWFTRWRGAQPAH